MTPIKAVVFDMDGVLIDGREWHYSALNKTLRLFGYSISPEDHFSLYDGLPTRKKLDMLTAQQGLPSGLHEFINELKQKYTMELIHKFCRPTFKHEYALQQLKIRGYKIGLASNSISATIDLMMEKAALKKYFDAVISAENVKIGKPDPEIYIKIFRKLKVDPGEVVVVEDNENGILAATLSGAHVLRVENPNQVTFERVLNFIDGVVG